MEAGYQFLGVLPAKNTDGKQILEKWEIANKEDKEIFSVRGPKFKHPKVGYSI